jgi:hypothetical protein
MKNKVLHVRRLSVSDGAKFNISRLPNFAASGSVAGMRNLYPSYKNARLVRCGSFIYNCDTAPEIYDAAK